MFIGAVVISSLCHRQRMGTGPVRSSDDGDLLRGAYFASGRSGERRRPVIIVGVSILFKTRSLRVNAELRFVEAAIGRRFVDLVYCGGAIGL